MELGPIGVGEVFWRDNPSAYVAQRTGTPNNAMGDMDPVSISDEATVIAALQKGDVPGGGGRNSDLLTDDERKKLNDINDHYGGQMSDQVGELGISLIMDKLMAKHSNREIPTLDQGYLSGIMDELRGGGKEGTLHSRLDGNFITELIESSHLLG